VNAKKYDAGVEEARARLSAARSDRGGSRTVRAARCSKSF
jgi:hypothetical protein